MSEVRERVCPVGHLDFGARLRLSTQAECPRSRNLPFHSGVVCENGGRGGSYVRNTPDEIWGRYVRKPPGLGRDPGPRGGRQEATRVLSAQRGWCGRPCAHAAEGEWLDLVGVLLSRLSDAGGTCGSTRRSERAGRHWDPCWDRYWCYSTVTRPLLDRYYISMRLGAKTLHLGEGGRYVRKRAGMGGGYYPTMT